MKLTDEELTRLAAEKVMGWRELTFKGTKWWVKPQRRGCKILQATFSPLTSWLFAGEIVDKMRADGWDYRISSSWEGRTGVEFFDLTKPYSDDDHMTYVDSGPRAITIAALLAVGAITEDQV